MHDYYEKLINDSNDYTNKLYGTTFSNQVDSVDNSLKINKIMNNNLYNSRKKVVSLSINAPGEISPTINDIAMMDGITYGVNTKLLM